MADGNVRFSVENLEYPNIVVQRDGDKFGALTFDVRNRLGTWQPLNHVNTFVYEDWGGQVPEQWAYLAPGDECSFYLVYNYAGRVKVGDEVRLHWETSGPLPSYDPEYEQPYPKKPLVLQLVVQEEMKP